MLDATLFMPPTCTLFASPFPGEGTSFLIRSAFPWPHRAGPQHHKVPWTSPFCCLEVFWSPGSSRAIATIPFGGPGLSPCPSCVGCPQTPLSTNISLSELDQGFPGCPKPLALAASLCRGTGTDVAGHLSASPSQPDLHPPLPVTLQPCG